MKLKNLKRFCATGLCLALMAGDVLPVIALDANASTVIPWENTVSGNDVAESTTSGNDIVEIEETAAPLEEAPVEEAFVTLAPVTVDGVTITLTAPAGAVPEDAVLVAELIEQQDELAVINEALESEAEKAEVEVQKYKAFDIRIMVGDEEVQPTEEVKVSFAGDVLLPSEEEETVAVYHVTEDAVANEMPAVVTETNEVEMETNHFSIYVITVSKDAASFYYDVAVEHKLFGGEDVPFYKGAVQTINKNGNLMVGVQGGGDYNVVKVVIAEENGNRVEVDAADINLETREDGIFLNLNMDTYEITSDATVTLYYAEKEASTFTSDVTFFDYSVMSDEITYSTEPMTLHSMALGLDDAFYFTYNGQRYEDYKIAEHLVNGYGINTVYKNGDKNQTVTFKDGDVLTNVRVDCWHDEGRHPNMGYLKVVVHERVVDGAITYYYEGVRVNAEFIDAGINANVFSPDGTRKNNYLAMGMNGYHNNQLYVVNKYNNGELLDANANSTNNPDNDWKPEYDHLAIAEGLVAGLSEADGYQTVIWGTAADGNPINAPGYFSATPEEGKTVYSDRFDLQFTKVGHKYVLNGSIDNENKDANGNPVMTKAGTGNKIFFPLNNVDYIDTADMIAAAGGSGEIYNSLVRDHGEEGFDPAKGNNCYFGMRYDFKFSVGDYLGPMQYVFEGDDDLWVFLDGELVLDLGGIHSAYPSAYPDDDVANGIASPKNYVDLWQFIKDENGNYDSNKQHQITVLYMERGGYDSTCYMEFMLPNATALHSVISDKPTTSITLTKVDENDKGVAGALFTLKNVESGEIDTVTSEIDGTVKFGNVFEGSYILTEQKAPDGYIRDIKEYAVTVSYNEGNWSIAGLPENNKVTNKKMTDLSFKKVDLFSLEGLAGAEFELWKEGVLVGTTTSGDDGTFIFTDLLSGTYTLKEVKAPIGYDLYKEDWVITVDAYKANPIVDVDGPNDGLWKEDIFQIGNEKTIALTLEKYWQYEDGEVIENIEVEEVILELKRKHADDASTQTCAGCGNWSENVVLTKEDGWKKTVTGLPYRDEHGEYEYYVEEQPIEGFDVLEYENGDLSNADWGYSQTITVTNTPAKGALKIIKKIDEMNPNYGAPTFTFKIESPRGEVFYRTITFDDANVTEKSVTVADIIVGDYTVTELDALRYECKSEVVQTKKVEAEETTVYEYENTLEFENYYSHSDVVVNVVTFERDEQGNITGSKISQEKSSRSEEVQN